MGDFTGTQKALFYLSGGLSLKGDTAFALREDARVDGGHNLLT